MIATATSNMMTTNTAQDIICPPTASKTFRPDVNVNGFTLSAYTTGLQLQNINYPYEKIEIRGTETDCSMSVRDSDGHRVTVGYENDIGRGLSIIDSITSKKTIYAASYIRQDDYTYNLPISSGTLALTSDMPDSYIKSASVSSNTLTLTNKDNSTIEFTPSPEPPSNMVTTDTDQTITGKKVFGTLQAASLTDGTTTKTMTEVLAGGGGSTTYMHVLKLLGTNSASHSISALTTIYTKSETPFDKDSLIAWANSKGLTNLPANGNGKIYTSNRLIVIDIKFGTVSSTSSMLNFECINMKEEATELNYDAVLSVEDTVIAVD